MVGREPVHDVRVAALPGGREDHVPPWSFLAEDRHVRAVRQPLRVAHLRVNRADRNLLGRARHGAGVLIDAGDEHHRPVRRAAGAVEQQPAAVRRPARPPRFRAAAEKADAPRRSVTGGARLPQPDVVGLILVRMERQPPAVRRPAERLIFRAGRLHDARRLCRRLRRIHGDDARVLRDVRILRIVHDAAPRAVRDAEEAPGRIPRRRLALKARERPARSTLGGRERNERAVALDLEQQTAVRGDGWRVGVARERGEPARPSAAGRRGPQVHGTGRIGESDVHCRAVRREGDGTVHVEIRIRPAAPPQGTVTRDRPSIVATHAISPRGVHAGNATRCPNR